MRLWEFILCTAFGAYLVVATQRGKYLPSLPSLSPTERKVADAVRTLTQAPANTTFFAAPAEEPLPPPRPYHELKREHLEELAMVERRISDFGADAASYMDVDPGYEGEPLAEELEP